MTAAHELIYEAIELRASEPAGRDLWFAVEDGFYPQADALHQAGMLDRRWCGNDPVWRLADEPGLQPHSRLPRAGASSSTPLSPSPSPPAAWSSVCKLCITRPRSTV